MRWAVPGWLEVFWGVSLNMDARVASLRLIPRPDLVGEGECAPAALEVALVWTAIDRMRGRRKPRLRVWCDAPEIAELSARRAGAIP